jgi:hypothetical protein
VVKTGEKKEDAAVEVEAVVGVEEMVQAVAMIEMIIQTPMIAGQLKMIAKLKRAH